MSLDVRLEKDWCSVCDRGDVVYRDNITHNLGKMAEEAGVYLHLWRPEELALVTASQLVKPLEEALVAMERDPPPYIRWSPANGWGSYASLVLFIRDYLKACREYPQARIFVSR